jgi:Na+/melibiose symporter-like transporter
MELASYAAPIGAAIFLWMPTMSILPGIYAKYFGLKLSAIAAVLFIARVFDGFTDPAIGYFADRHCARHGSYKSWVAVGGIGLVIAAYFLFSPPQPVSQRYYLGWSLVFYLSWSLIDIPHAAWGATLAPEYYGRARVFGSRATSIYFGLTIFFALPFLPLFTSREYTPETMRWTVYVGAAVMCACLVLMSRAPKVRIVEAWRPDTPRAIVHSVISNKPLLIFLAAYFVSGITYGMWFGLVFVYLDGYLHLAGKISVIFLLGNIAGMLSMPLWLKLTRRTSKSTVWAAGIALFIVLLSGGYLVKPGASWWISLLLTGGVYVSFACQTMAAQSILGDVTDYGQLKSHHNRGATYFALLTLSYKVTSGLGTGLALSIVGYFGFDARATAQSEAGIFGLHLAFMLLPVSCALIAFVLTFCTPITPDRHRIIRRRIESRTA